MKQSEGGSSAVLDTCRLVEKSGVEYSMSLLALCGFHGRMEMVDVLLDEGAGNSNVDMLAWIPDSCVQSAVYITSAERDLSIYKQVKSYMAMPGSFPNITHTKHMLMFFQTIPPPPK